MTEKTRCFVYGEEVTVIDGYCQVDCSIEECTLNLDNAPDSVRKKLKKTEAGQLGEKPASDKKR